MSTLDSGHESGLKLWMAPMTGQRLLHYQILEKLGEGGMGVVYKARDTHLDRFVAIKVLPPERIADPQRKARFVQEAKAASALNHPNIVAVHDISSDDGRDFIAMEYVAGKTLDQLIPRHGMRLNEALKCAVQVADALSRAHAAGIVHRDLKPGNIMVDEHGLVKMLDFGLAKLTEVEPPEDGEATRTLRPTTEEGTILGTAAYMSPEQAEAKPLDARSDIFSFGSVLYEMVTGQRAFQGDSKISMLGAIIHKEPAPLEAAIPQELQKLIIRCLRKDPERRFQHMADIRVALAEMKEESDSGKLIGPDSSARPRGRRLLWPAVAAVGLLALATAGIFVWQRMHATPLTERDWIVLADFTNTTGDPVFDVALKHALAASLNQSPYLNVLPDERVLGKLREMGRSSEDPLTGRAAREICERAGAKALLTGSISALGSHYGIGLDATNCRTGETLALEQGEADSKEQVLAVLGRAATRMRRKLGESVASIQKLDIPLQEVTTSSLEALKAFSLGRERQNKGDNRQAISLHERAIEIDPNFAMAYANLGMSYGNLGEYDLAGKVSAKAFNLRQRVGERERLVIEMAYYRLALGDLEKAMEVYGPATRMYPREWIFFNDSALAYSALGQPEKAVVLFGEAKRISGGSIVYPYGNLANAYFRLNRFAEAREMAEQAVAKFAPAGAHRILYELARIDGDNAAMEQQAKWFRGKTSEHSIVQAQANTAAAGGQFQKSRELRNRAFDLARRAGLNETAASSLANQALLEAVAENFSAAREKAVRAVQTARTRNVVHPAALAMVLSGSTAPAQALMDEFTNRYPSDTALKNVSVPSVQAVKEMTSGNARTAVELLESASGYDLGTCRGCGFVLYLRGQAYLKAGAGQEAAAAFQKVLDHRGAFNGIQRPLSNLGLGRAQALLGNAAEARKSYDDFFALWKNADPDIPILKKARAEYAKLR